MFYDFTDVQPVADHFKQLVMSQPPSNDRRRALAAINRFERCQWHPTPMHDAMNKVAPGQLYWTDSDALGYQDAPDNPITLEAAVMGILAAYMKQMPPEPRPLLSTDEAAAYLGISSSTVRNYIYTKEILEPSKRIGRVMQFDPADLDAIRADPPVPGRPSLN